MRIHYVSDLHLELLDDPSETTKLLMLLTSKDYSRGLDMLILAGDLGSPYQASYRDMVVHFSSQFLLVILIAGNHEYSCRKDTTHHNMIDIKDKIRDVIRPFSNVKFLDNDYLDVGNIRWIGTTLWTHIDDPDNLLSPKCESDKSTRLTVTRHNSLHNEALNFLHKTLNCADLPCVIISHHMPLKQLTSHQYQGENWNFKNQWYSANCWNICEKYKDKIKAWIYGHTHVLSVQMLLDIRFLCNPVGYTHENNTPKLESFELKDH